MHSPLSLSVTIVEDSTAVCFRSTTRSGIKPQPLLGAKIEVNSSVSSHPSALENEVMCRLSVGVEHVLIGTTRTVLTARM